MANPLLDQLIDLETASDQAVAPASESPSNPLLDQLIDLETASPYQEDLSVDTSPPVTPGRSIESPLPQLSAPYNFAEADSGIGETPLVLGDFTGKHTNEGRKIFHNNFGGVSSEYTIGVENPSINGGELTHIPSIYDGKLVDQQTAEQIIIKNKGKDPDTGRFIKPGGDPEARSKSLGAFDSPDIDKAWRGPEYERGGEFIAGAGETLFSLMSGLLGASVGTMAGALEDAAGLAGKDKFDTEQFLKTFGSVSDGFTYEPRTEQGKMMLGMIHTIFEKYNIQADKATEILIDPEIHPKAATALNAFFKGAPLVLPFLRRGPKGGPDGGGPKGDFEFGVPVKPTKGAIRVEALFEAAKRENNVVEAQNAFVRAAEHINDRKKGMTREEARRLRKEVFRLRDQVPHLKDVTIPMKKGLFQMADGLISKLKNFIPKPIKPTPAARTKSDSHARNRGNLFEDRDIRVQPRKPDSVIDAEIEASLKPQNPPSEVRARNLDVRIRNKAAEINEAIQAGAPIRPLVKDLSNLQSIQDRLRETPEEPTQGELLEKEPSLVQPITPDDPAIVRERAEQVARGTTAEGQKEFPDIDKEKQVIKNEGPVPAEGKVPRVGETVKEIKELLGKRVDQIRTTPADQILKFKPVVEQGRVLFPGILGKTVEGIDQVFREDGEKIVVGQVPPEELALGEKVDQIDQIIPEGGAPLSEPGITQGFRYQHPIQFRGEEIQTGQFASDIGEFYDKLAAEKGKPSPDTDIVRHYEQEISQREEIMAREVRKMRLAETARRAEAKTVEKPLEIKYPGREAKKTRRMEDPRQKNINPNGQLAQNFVGRIGGLNPIDAARYGITKDHFVRKGSVPGLPLIRKDENSGLHLDKVQEALAAHGFNLEIEEIVEAIKENRNFPTAETGIDYGAEEARRADPNFDAQLDDFELVLREEEVKLARLQGQLDKIPPGRSAKVKKNNAAKKAKKQAQIDSVKEDIASSKELIAKRKIDIESERKYYDEAIKKMEEDEKAQKKDSAGTVPTDAQPPKSATPTIHFERDIDTNEQQGAIFSPEDVATKGEQMGDIFDESVKTTKDVKPNKDYIEDLKEKTPETDAALKAADNKAKQARYNKESKDTEEAKAALNEALKIAEGYSGPVRDAGLVNPIIELMTAKVDKPDGKIYGKAGSLAKSHESDPDFFPDAVGTYFHMIEEAGGRGHNSIFNEVFEPPEARPDDYDAFNQRGSFEADLFLNFLMKGGEKISGMFGKKKRTPSEQAFIDDFKDSESWRLYEKGRREAEELYVTSMKKTFNSIDKGILNRRGPLRRKILEEAGPIGWKAITAMDLAQKASAKTHVEVGDLKVKTFGKLDIEKQHLLSSLIFEKSKVELGTLRPDVANPGGALAEDILERLAALRRDYPAEYKELDDMAEIYSQAMRAIPEELYQEGLITKKFRDDLLKRQDYARREFIEKIDPENTAGFRGAPGSIYDAGIAHLQRGHITSLNEDAMLQAYVGLTIKNNRIAKNQALVEFSKFLKSNPFSSIGRMSKPGKPVPSGMEEITFLVAGKPQSMVLHSDYAQQLKTSDPQVSRYISSWASFFSGAGAVRATATALNPAFTIGNIPRDVFWDYISSPEYSVHLPIYFAQMAKDLMATFKYLPSPGDFREDIVKTGFGRKMQIRGVTPHLLSDEGVADLKFVGKYFDAGKTYNAFIKYAQWSQASSELWIRLAVAKRNYDNGLARFKKENGGRLPARGSEAGEALLRAAAFAGRSTADFDAGGLFTKALNNIFPYTNAGAALNSRLFDIIFLVKPISGQNRKGFAKIFDPIASNTRIPFTGPIAKKLGQGERANAGKGPGIHINDDFILKSAWVMGLGALAWHFAHGDEQKDEMMARISAKEKELYFIIPIPQANYIDKDGEIRHGYLRIAKSHEARPLLTLMEGILERRAGREFDYSDVVSAAKSMIAIIPDQAVGMPISNFLSALSNIDNWKNDKIWKSELGGPVLPKSEVKYNTNPALVAAANTPFGMKLRLSPARTQVAIGKLFVPTNPGVMAVGEILNALARFGGAEPSLLDQEEGFQAQSRRFPFIEKLLRHTYPIRQDDAKNIQESLEKAGTKNLELKKLVNKHLRNEAKGQAEEALDHVIDSIENTAEQDKWRAKVDKERIRRDSFTSDPLIHARMLRKLSTINDTSTRVKAAFATWRRLPAEKRDAFAYDLERYGGIWTSEFQTEFNDLTDSFRETKLE